MEKCDTNSSHMSKSSKSLIRSIQTCPDLAIVSSKLEAQSHRQDSYYVEAFKFDLKGNAQRLVAYNYQIAEDKKHKLTSRLDTDTD